MKKIQIIYRAFIILFIINACTDERSLDFLDAIPAPSNVSAVYTITQDNSGLVTITPTAEGASSFDIYFGDATPDPDNVVNIENGKNVQHTYTEGTYTINIVAYNAKGDTTEVSQELIVSFQAPQNLVVTIENDAAVSKRVNITATADFASMFEFHSGETGVTQPVGTANIGDTFSYQYAAPGIYSVKVIAKGGAIETTEYTVDFEVTEILAPLAPVAAPPAREASDVVSIFSDVYTGVTLDELPTGWSSSGFEAITIGTDNVWKLTNLDFLGIVTNYANGIDVSSMEKLHIDYWVPEGTTNELLVKIVNTIDGGEDIESLGTTVGGSWQSIDLDMTGFDGGNLSNKNKITQILIDSEGTAGVVYVDNFYFYKAASGVVNQSVQDFEGTPPAFTDFGNIAPVEVVSNPDISGANTTLNTAKLVKSAGSEVWAGAFFDVSSPLDLINFSKMSIKTWSPKSGATVRLKLENSSDNTQFFEVDATTSIANAWEELTFDLSAANTTFTYDRVVVFFDFGNAGDDSVYYYDEINLVNDSGGGTNTPVLFQDFEGTPPAFTDFGNIAPVEVVPNPDMSGVNTTSNSAKLTKSAGSEVWAGAFFDVTTPLDLNTYSKMSIKTWSPKSGATVRLKLENSADNTQFFEVDATTSTTNSWEELIFDLSGADLSFTYDRVVIFFDFGNAGDDSIYHYDELALTN